MRSYFGGGVVVPPEFFLLFLPPLWPFLPDLVFAVLAVAAFFPGGSGCGFNELLSPPVCAMTRPAPRSNVITNVEIFFIRFSVSDFYQDLVEGSSRKAAISLPGILCVVLTPAARDSFLRRQPDALTSLKSGLIDQAGSHFFSNKKRRPFPGRLSLNFICSYFGGGVVVPPEFFLDFFPPL